MKINNSNLEGNWWEIGDEQNLHLNPKELEFIREKIVNLHGSLYSFGKKFSLRSLYHELKYKNQGMKVSLLKRVLAILKIPLSKVGKYPVNVGRFKFSKVEFPLKIKPSFGQVLANGFFDGYADSKIMRYQNFDKNVREEFCLCIKDFIEGAKIPINNPKNVENSITLPAFVSKLLISLLSIKTFLGDTCRVPELFLEIVRKSNNFGWYFLKGAFLDEGTVKKSREIFILTGIKNKPLVKDTQRIAEILGLSTKITSHRKGYYNLRLNAESFENFYEGISILFFTDADSVDKWNRVVERVEARRRIERRKEEIIQGYKKILKECEKRGGLTTKEVMEICDLPYSTAYFRVHVLIHNGNLEKKYKGKTETNKYILRSKNLSDLPTTNKMRRERGWR